MSSRDERNDKPNSLLALHHNSLLTSRHCSGLCHGCVGWGFSRFVVEGVVLDDGLYTGAIRDRKAALHSILVLILVVHGLTVRDCLLVIEKGARGNEN